MVSRIADVPLGLVIRAMNLGLEVVGKPGRDRW
jgi:hypothetical protein